MKIKPKQYAIALYEAANGLPDEKVKLTMANFIKILVKNNALRMAPQIVAYFSDYANRMTGAADLEIKTAEPIDEKLLNEIKEAAPDLLGKKFKKINVKKEVDASLIGGFVLHCEDMVFDGSLKNKFKILKNNLFTK